MQKYGLARYQKDFINAIDPDKLRAQLFNNTKYSEKKKKLTDE